MDDSDDELSDAPILLTDKRGPGEGERRDSLRENGGNEKLKECCKAAFSYCGACLHNKKVSRSVTCGVAKTVNTRFGDTLAIIKVESEPCYSDFGGNCSYETVTDLVILTPSIKLVKLNDKHIRMKHLAGPL